MPGGGLGFGGGRAMIRYYACTQKGTKRSENQDRVLVEGTVLSAGNCKGACEQELLAAVCDGVGSRPGGGEAARIAAETLALYRRESASESCWRRAFLAANEEIREKQRADPELSGMSTTVTSLLIRSGKAQIFHVGDSRAYRCTEGGLVLLTEDHVLTEEAGREGQSPEPGKAQPSRPGGLERYLGGRDADCVPALTSESIPEGGCLYLLCSDGLWRWAEEGELAAVLCREGELAEKGRALMELALHKGSTDDRSLVLLRCLA